jgi:hypothetical protein
VIHDRQGLTLGLEAGYDLARVHAGLDDFERDAAADGLVLLGHEDDAHATFADLLEQLIGADLGAGRFERRLGDRCAHARRRRIENETFLPLVLDEQPLDAREKFLVARARGFKKRCSLGRVVLLQSLDKQISLAHGRTLFGNGQM